MSKFYVGNIKEKDSDSQSIASFVTRKYRHKKSGNLYTYVTEGALEGSQEIVIVYFGTDHKIWVRPKDEFFEKFEAMQ